MKKSANTKPKRKLPLFFKRLSESWAIITVILAMAAAGFRGGMYLQETRMLREETERERTRIIEMRQMIDQWAEKEVDLRSEIDRLKTENSQLHMRLLKYEEEGK